MKLGVLLDITWPLAKLERTAKAAIEAGFDQLWINEHPQDWDPFLALGRVTRADSDVPVGLGTVNPWARHPMVLAASATTLGQVLGVPVDLGIGSSRARHLDPIGIERSRDVRGTAEAVQAVKGLLTGNPYSLDGEVFKLSEAQLRQSPEFGVRVLVGASGGPKMLSVAGELGDGMICPAGNYAFYRSMVKDFWDARGATAGEGEASPRPVKVVVNGTIIVEEDDSGDADREARAFVREVLRYRIHSPPTLERMGITRDEAATWSEAPQQIPEELLQEAVVRGDVAECVARLEELEKIGVTQFVLRFPSVSRVRRVGEVIS